MPPAIGKGVCGTHPFQAKVSVWTLLPNAMGWRTLVKCGGLWYWLTRQLFFTESATMGWFSHRVAMSVSFPVLPLDAVFFRPFIGSEITWSVSRPLTGPPSLPSTWKIGNSKTQKLINVQYCLFCYRCYYLHWSRDSVLPVHMIFGVSYRWQVTVDSWQVTGDM